MLDKNKKKIEESGKQGAFSLISSKFIEKLQWVKYRSHQTGHGFTAEDANALNDRLRFRKVEVVGLSNEKNGADRIVTDRSGNVQYIQTKYYNSAENTINSAFDKDTGMYRYKKQVIEVPKDQYEEAVEKMAQKIREGKVPRVNDPNEAKNMVKKGDVTYRQSKNIAKARNIDSLIFDIKNQSITAISVFGISFIIQYSSCIWSGMEKNDAMKLSVISGLKSSGIALGVGILTQQFLRTTAGRGFAAFSTVISKRVINSLYTTEIGKKIVHKLASAILGKQLAGAAAKNAVAKLLRTNMITASITTTVITLPDFWKALISKKISWGQFTKNLSVNVAGVAGGAAGAWGGSVGGAAAGAALGGVIGSAVPGAGTVAGAALGAKVGTWVGVTLGGLGGGVGSAIGAKKLFDLVKEDDAKIMLEIAQDSIAQLAIDYMITESEYEVYISDKIADAISPKWLEKMYQSGKSYPNCNEQQFQFAYNELEYIFEEAISLRTSVSLPSDKEIRRLFRKTYRIMFFEYISNKIRVLFGGRDVIKENE